MTPDNGMPLSVAVTRLESESVVDSFPSWPNLLPPQHFRPPSMIPQPPFEENPDVGVNDDVTIFDAAPSSGKSDCREYAGIWRSIEGQFTLTQPTGGPSPRIRVTLYRADVVVGLASATFAGSDATKRPKRLRIKKIRRIGHDCRSVKRASRRSRPGAPPEGAGREPGEAGLRMRSGRGAPLRGGCRRRPWQIHRVGAHCGRVTSRRGRRPR
jgi:hypothetical protein